MADLLVELLAVEECPHLEQARRDLESVLGGGILETPIQLILVGSADDAEFLGFQGSPTIRVNGDDVVPQPGLPIALGCRIYRDAEGRAAGSPSIESIRAAVDAHRRDRLAAFQREEAAKVAEFAREADVADAARATGAAELSRAADSADASTGSSTGSEGQHREG